MNIFKLKNYPSLLIICTILPQYSSAAVLLIDDFTDTDLTKHRLASGSTKGIGRGKIENSDPSHVNFSDSVLNLNQSTNLNTPSKHSLYYSILSANLFLDYYSKINFKVRDVVFNKTSTDIKPLAKVAFFDTDDTPFIIDNIDLSNMNSNSTFSIDLTPPSLKQIDHFFIYFNTGQGIPTYSIELDSIEFEAVPEPLSMLTSIVGITGFIKKIKNS